MAQQAVRGGVQRWPWVIAALVIAVAVVFAWPIGLPVLAAGMIVGGVTGYRQSRQPVVRAVAVAAIAAGVVIILALVVIGLTLFSVGSGTTVSEGVAVTEPAP